MQILNVITDEAADSVYLQFGNQPISHSVELTGDIIIDLDEENAVVGMDIQHMSEVMKGLGTAEIPAQAATAQMKLQLVPA